MLDIIQEILLSADTSPAEVGLNIPAQPVILNTLSLNQLNVPALSCRVIEKNKCVRACACVCVFGIYVNLSQNRCNAVFDPQWTFGW